MKYAAPAVPVAQYNGTNSADIVEVFESPTYLTVAVEDLEEVNGVLSLTFVINPQVWWDRAEQAFTINETDWVVFVRDGYFVVVPDTEFQARYILAE